MSKGISTGYEGNNTIETKFQNFCGQNDSKVFELSGYKHTTSDEKLRYG